MKKDKNHKMEAVEQFKFDFEKSLVQTYEKLVWIMYLCTSLVFVDFA